VLVVQSLPFLAATGLAAIEGSRFNGFGYWRGIAGKLAAALGTEASDLLPQSQGVITQVMAEPPKVSADNIEAAQ